MGSAIIDIDVGERDTPATLDAGYLHIGTNREQRRCQIATESRMATLTLRGDMTGVAMSLEAVLVRLAPPFALIVKNTACVETEISANGSQRAVAWASYGSGGLRNRSIV